MSHYIAVINVVLMMMMSSSLHFKAQRFWLRRSDFFHSHSKIKSLLGWSQRYSHSQAWSWGEVKCLNKCSHTKMLLCSWILRFMASVPCTVGMINTAWLSKEVVGMEHLPLGGSLGAVKEFVTHLRRQDTSSYLFVCHKSTCSEC